MQQHAQLKISPPLGSGLTVASHVWRTIASEIEANAAESVEEQNSLSAENRHL